MGEGCVAEGKSEGWCSMRSAQLSAYGIRYFHKDSRTLPRDYHELTCILLIQLYHL